MKYIAYGSNMNLKQMKIRCPKSKVAGVGYIKGWKLYFNTYADIKYTGNKEDITPVVIWDIAKEDWATLDSYEGYPNYYTKEVIKTHFINGNGKVIKTEKCIAYVMTDIRGNQYDRPFDSYVDGILVGYLQHNINFEKLFEALDYSERQRARAVVRLYDSGAYYYVDRRTGKKSK